MLIAGKVMGQTGRNGPVPDTAAIEKVLSLEQGFQHPPAAAKPWFLWYWMKPAVSKAGIRAGLEAMKEEGVGGAYLMPLEGLSNTGSAEPSGRQFSSARRSKVRYAMKEANRLGLKLAIHACDSVTELRIAWDESPGVLKIVQDSLYTQGANRLAFAYNPTANRRGDKAADGERSYFRRDQTGWRPASAWIDYTQRCQWLLQQGRPEAFRGPIFEGISLEKDLIATESDRRWTTAPTQEDSSSEIIIPALRKATGLAYTHRTAPGLDIYFVSNQQDRPRIINLSLRVSGRKPELWDAVTGEITPAHQWSQHGGRTILPVKLEANGCLFLVFRQPSSGSGAIDADDEGDNYIDPVPVETLSAAWTLQFDSAKGGPVRPIVFDSLQDWSRNADSAIRYYSGTAVYRQSFQWQQPAGERLWLDLGRVANIARITLNGVDCGVAWTSPYWVEVTKAIEKGNNELTIEVTNTWANRLVGDHFLPENKRITRTTAPYHLDGKLLPAGLLGPIQLVR